VELPGNRGDAIRHRSLLLTGEARQSGYMNCPRKNGSSVE
jgi:hypothetical protein